MDGSWADADSGHTFPVVNPATGETLAEVPRMGSDETQRALAAAERALPDWKARTAKDRARILRRLADLMLEREDDLARLMVLEQGKPLAEARVEVAYAASFYEWFGEEAKRVYGDTIPTPWPGKRIHVTKEPVGVTAGITPWNFPAAMPTRKSAPALAAGCTMVLKPAEQTPMTALEIPKILEEAGLPAGVLNVITGFGETAGAPLVDSPKVDKVGFTGSLEVGKIIMRNGADTLKRVTLELGGKSPNIFYSDAAFDEAVEGTTNGIFWNQGEICSAGSRVFVESSIYDDALQAMVDRGKQVKVGRGLDPDTTMGPLVSKEQQERVLGYIEKGKNEAKVALLGDGPSDPALSGGYFVPPTIFYDSTNDTTIAREEIFGPVMTVIPFKDVDEVIRLSNDNDYGLAAAVWTRDIKKAINTAKALRAGTVWINDSQPAPTEAPWGGYKQSGVGRELGPQGIEDYLELKHIYINLVED